VTSRIASERRHESAILRYSGLKLAHRDQPIVYLDSVTSP
jgi:hypothetical protein